VSCVSSPIPSKSNGLFSGFSSCAPRKVENKSCRETVGDEYSLSARVLVETQSGEQVDNSGSVFQKEELNYIPLFVASVLPSPNVSRGKFCWYHNFIAAFGSSNFLDTL
jgi:hypothetical protein